jgi:AraC family transcriptional regulator
MIKKQLVGTWVLVTLVAVAWTQYAGGAEMKPKIVDNEGLNLIGMVFYGDPFKGGEGWSEENEIGKLWTRFIAKEELIENRVGEGGYEVHIEPEEYKNTRNFYVFVGVEIEEVTEVPHEMFVKVLPPTTYAVFTFKGEEIGSNWPESIYKEWLPGSPYKEAHKYLIEYYDGTRFKGMDNPESELDVYVPVKKKNL